MKIRRTIISFIASALVACTAICGVVSAESIENSTTTFEVSGQDNAVFAELNSTGDAVVYGSDVPTALWDWSKGNYTGSFLPLYRTRQVYTNYKFKTGTNQLTVNLEAYADENWTNDRKLTVKLYKSGIFGIWTLDDQWTLNFSPDASNHSKKFTGSHTFKDLSNSSNYYILFYNDSTYVSGSSGSNQYAIGCSFSVSV